MISGYYSGNVVIAEFQPFLRFNPPRWVVNCLRKRHPVSTLLEIQQRPKTRLMQGRAYMLFQPFLRFNRTTRFGVGNCCVYVSTLLEIQHITKEVEECVSMMLRVSTLLEIQREVWKSQTSGLERSCFNPS